MLEERMDRFLQAAERMRLADYIAFESDRKRRLLDAFWQGVARGLGIMVGFSVLGAALLFILQPLIILLQSASATLSASSLPVQRTSLGTMSGIVVLPHYLTSLQEPINLKSNLRMPMVSGRNRFAH